MEVRRSVGTKKRAYRPAERAIIRGLGKIDTSIDTSRGIARNHQSAKISSQVRHLETWRKLWSGRWEETPTPPPRLHQWLRAQPAPKAIPAILPGPASSSYSPAKASTAGWPLNNLPRAHIPCDNGPMHPLFDIQTNHIQALDDGQARELLARLCRSQLQRAGLDPAAVFWGGNQLAGDGGSMSGLIARRLARWAALWASVSPSSRSRRRHLDLRRLNPRWLPKGSSGPRSFH